jgi:hypothetical protein
MYDTVAEMDKDEYGVVTVSNGLLTRVKGWWWDEAVKRVTQKIEELEIPWDELKMDDAAARDDEVQGLCERLAVLTYWITKVGREKARVESLVFLAKNALDHATNKKMAATSRSDGAVSVRTSIVVSGNQVLRNAQIEVWESEAYRKQLDGTLEILELNWRLVSRIMSARMAEPIE